MNVFRQILAHTCAHLRTLAHTCAHLRTLALVTFLFSFSFSINAQKTLNNEKSCGTPDMTIEEGKKLPYYGNNAFLSHYVDSLTPSLSA
jgi:hypothetical protein